MEVSTTLRKLAKWVIESEGEERCYAEAVFMDVAIREGAKDAERFCAKVLAQALSERLSQLQVDEDGEVLEAQPEEVAKAGKVTVEYLTEIAGKLDPDLDEELLMKIAKIAMRLDEVEQDRKITTKLAGLKFQLRVLLKVEPVRVLLMAAGSGMTTMLQLAA